MFKTIYVFRYLASGDLQRHIASCYRVSKQHFGDIIDHVCNAIIQEFSDEIPKWTPENIKEFAKEFEIKCNLPNCISAIDGKHVPVKAPANSGSLFYNYKVSKRELFVTIIQYQKISPC